MATPNKLQALERERGNLHDLIPALVNERGQAGAAAALGVSGATISTWLRDNGYRQSVRYVQQVATEPITDFELGKPRGASYGAWRKRR